MFNYPNQFNYLFLISLTILFSNHNAASLVSFSWNYISMNPNNIKESIKIRPFLYPYSSPTSTVKYLMVSLNNDAISTKN
jgi:hypothetical protein